MEAEVTDRLSKGVMIAAVVLVLPLAALLAYSRPGYLANTTYLGGIVLCECLLAAVMFFRKVFFPLVVMAFLLAGVELPVGTSIWAIARWIFLGVGALVGTYIMLKERRTHFGLFHTVAGFAILTAVISAIVSRYPQVALLKALSLLLLFLYASTGARLAAIGRETRFFNGLILGCELFVGSIGMLHLAGIEAMGNPNSLGAVMGVVAVPILLWSTMLEENEYVHRRRQIMFLFAMYLTLHSQERAGIAAAFGSCGLMCVALRRYKLLGQGLVITMILVTGSAILDPEAFSKTTSSATSLLLYKGHDAGLGVMASRQTPWQTAVDSIHKHFWFGTGFGTADNGQDVGTSLDPGGRYASNTLLTSENGSSYLTIMTWVGVLGAAPFLFLVLVVLRNIWRTVAWMSNSTSPYHPAVPLAMVVLAGLINAGFEDWLFAVGYYLSVFFWCLAFVLADVLPARQNEPLWIRARPVPAMQSWHGVPSGD
jgi:O-antigen ligase